MTSITSLTLLIMFMKNGLQLMAPQLYGCAQESDLG
jgi:hypothetical protein